MSYEKQQGSLLVPQGSMRRKGNILSLVQGFRRRARQMAHCPDNSKGLAALTLEEPSAAIQTGNRGSY